MHIHPPSWSIISSKAAANVGLPALIPSIFFTALALVAIILRWYTRAFLIRRIACEDVLIAIAMVFSLGMAGVVGGEVEIDTMSTNDKIHMSLISTMMKLVFAQSIFFHTGVNLVKASIIVQYTHVFASSAGVRITCFVLLFLIVAASAWGILGVIFLCRPTHKYWDPNASGTCMDPEKHFWTSAIIGIILDFAIWLLPIPLIGKLSLPKKQKFGLFVVFGLGAFVCITSILRLVLVHDAAEAENVTKSGTYAVIWSTIELNVAIICASLMVMKPLFLRLFPKLSSTSASTISGGCNLERGSRRCTGLTGSTLTIGEVVAKGWRSSRVGSRSENWDVEVRGLSV